MSANTVENPLTVVPTEGKQSEPVSKSSKKKKSKAAGGAVTPTPPVRTESANGSNNQAEGADSDNSYIRELQKNIRNINKKLNLSEKVATIVEKENAGTSVDELVASRKINTDQKEQYNRRAALQKQLVELEEQLAKYRKLDEDYQKKSAREKELLQSAHAEELEKLRETLKAESEIEAQKTSKQRLLTLSRFLRAAAARRQQEEDESDLSKAFEGALLLVYGGDASAVAAAEKLIDGTDDKVTSTEGVVLDVTYAQVQKATLEEAPFAIEEAWVDSVAEASPDAPESDSQPASDPTVAHAGLTEIDTTTQIPTQHDPETETPEAPATTSIDDGAANQAAQDQWDNKEAGSDDPLAESFEMVPRDPAETETPTAPAGAQNTNWADDAANEAATKAAETPAPTAPANDGFAEVRRDHGRGGRGRGGPDGGRGGYRGRGRGGGFRGDRGDGFRGRGRGGFRGDRGDGFRGGRSGAPRGGESS